MTNDIRVLARKRFEAGKDLHSSVPKNRHERRARERHAKLLEATRMRMVGQKGIADSTEKMAGTLREEVERVEAPAGFVKRGGLFVPIAVALELAVAIACGGIAFDEPDVDAEQDADVAADMEPDADVSEDDGAAEDVSPAEDVETPDEGTVEDAAPEEDGGVEDVEDVPDAPEVEDVPDTPEDVVDAPDVEEVPDVVDVPESEASDGEEAEDSGTEADAPECTRSVTIEPATSTGPEPVCGSSQVVTVSTEVTRLEGSPECEAVVPVRRVVGKRVMLSPYLDVSALACARGAMTNALNGQELIVDLTPTNLNTAVTLVPCRNLGIMGVLDGGPGEYDATLQDVRAYLVLNVTPPSGSSRFINAYNTGVAELWTHDRAYVAAVINEATLHGTLCYVYFPITTRTGTYSEVWTAGDYGTFTHNLLVVGPQLQGWEWVRP
jgi:cytoskeletal protein RodZ